MFEKSSFDTALYGECLLLEDTINNFEVKIKEDSILQWLDSNQLLET